MQQNEKSTLFCLYPKHHEDLYKTMPSQLTGGFSVIFTGLAIAGETRIQPHEIPDPKTC